MEAMLKRSVQQIWHRRWLALAVIALTVATAFLSTVAAHPTYVGKSALVVSSPGTMTQQDALLVSGYVTLFNDPATIERLRAAHRIPEDVAFESRAAAASPILTIEATADSPTVAQDSAQQMTEAFRDDINAVRETGTKAAVAELQSQLDDLRSQPAPPDSPNANQISQLQTRVDTMESDSTSQLQDLQMRAGVSEISKRIGENLLFGLAAGVVLGILAALGFASISSRLTDSTGMHEKTGIVPLVEIPDAGSARKRLIRGDRLRRLSNLISFEQTAASTVLAVTDARGANAARALGRSLAELSAGQRPTVLVYADNSPGDLVGPGFNEALTNSRLTVVMLQKDANTALQILPAGEYVNDSYGLISKERVFGVIEALRAVAELTIIVTPSITEAPEAELLCGAADATLLVVDSRFARAADVRYATERLERTHVEKLGTVLFHSTKEDGVAKVTGAHSRAPMRAGQSTSAPEQLP
ncbi:MAG: hypothetical protein QOJ80_832 [Mycobacterium sp.]|nr:hypothetical protein [Mycobacterium sp.]